MKIHIIGPGVVGRATGGLFSRYGHEVAYTDRGDDHAAVRAPLHMVCTPEAVARQVVRSLGMAPHYEVLTEGMTSRSNWTPGIQPDEAIVIRSSVPPGTTQELYQELQRPIFHIPEFLREATAEADAVDARSVLIGQPILPDQRHYQAAAPQMGMLTSLYASISKEVSVLWSTETELLKLANNAHLASLVSWWNEVMEIASAYGVNSHHMARIMTMNDPRLSTYGAHRHGSPYGGHCLPKDLNQLIAAAEERGIKTPLLQAVRAINRDLMDRSMKL